MKAIRVFNVEQIVEAEEGKLDIKGVVIAGKRYEVDGPKSFHTELIDFLKIYYFVGGMPEAIVQYAEDKDLNKVRNIQDEILSAYTIQA